MTDIQQLEFKRISIAKIVTVAIGFCSVCLTIGYEAGQIKSRFDADEIRLAKVEQWQADYDKEEMNKARRKIYSSCIYPYFNLQDLGITRDEHYYLICKNP